MALDKKGILGLGVRDKVETKVRAVKAKGGPLGLLKR